MRALKIAAMTALAALAACSDDAPKQQNQAQTSNVMTPGLYEAGWTVSEVRSTDKTDPATKLTVGTSGDSKGCVDGPAIDLALFAEGEDQCKQTSSYVRGGRINLQMQCKRDGEDGPVMQTVTGTSTGDSFEAEVSTSTYLTGFGDYSMVRTVTGKRVGACEPESPAAPGAS
ncbi:MAG: DUF3617 family protein [Sphingomonas sp.]|nr:DUF3617 family protein [Sphingomonas sp.]